MDIFQSFLTDGQVKIIWIKLEIQLCIFKVLLASELNKH